MYKQYIAFTTIAKKEIIRFFRIWQQALIPPMITSVLYFTIFGEILGNNIGKISGIHYIDFIIPGLVIMQIISSAYTNNVFSFFTEKFSRNIEEVIKSPTKSSIIILGYTLGSTLRGLITGISILFVASFFTKIQFHNPLLMLTVAIMAALLFSLLGLINGILAKTWDDVSWVSSFIITPMSYLGGIFYSVRDLNPFWQKMSLLNPIFYFVDSFRYAMININTLSTYTTLSLGLTAIIITWITAVLAFKKFTQR